MNSGTAWTIADGLDFREIKLPSTAIFVPTFTRLSPSHIQPEQQHGLSPAQLRCPLWVIRCGAIQPPSRLWSVVSPTATLVLQCSEMTRCAMCGRLRVGKNFLHVCSIGRC